MILMTESKKVGYFWQVTDPHIDLLYKPGSNAKCDVPVCCREKTPKQKETAGRFGHYGACDTPVETIESALQFIKSFVPSGASTAKPDFVLYGGDTLPHDVWLYNPEYNMQYDAFMANLFAKYFDPEEIAVWPTIGNHEPYPVDQLDPVPPAAEWFLHGHAKNWEKYIHDPEARKMHEEYGYYSVNLRKGLRLVVLNTQWEDPLNFYLYRKGSEDDPANQLQWLTNTLTDAENAGERVYILGHIPPGISNRKFSAESLDSFNKKYTAIVERFSETIVFQTFGHTHKNNFRVFTDVETHTQPTGVAFITPASTSYGSQSPSVRLYEYDLDTFELVDMKTYYANITEANIKDEITWRLAYSTRELYGMPDLKPASWLRLANQLQTDKSLWQKFDRLYRVLQRPSSCAFGARCHKLHTCAITSLEMMQYAKCAGL